MPRLSIVIPVVGNVAWLEDTLLSVLENRPEDCEILVVLDQPYADPYELKEEIRFLEIPEGSGWVASVNLGIGAAQGTLVHVLQCGCHVHDGWADRALDHFEDPTVGTVVPVVLEPNPPHRIMAAGSVYRLGGGMGVLAQGWTWERGLGSRLRPVAATPLAGFYRRAALERIGLFSLGVGDWLASVDAGLALQTVGFRTVLEPDCRVVAAHVPCRIFGAFRRALDLERFYWRWAPRGGWIPSLGMHAFRLAAESLWALATFRWPVVWAGRLMGMAHIGSHRRLLNRLEQLQRLYPAGEPAVAAPHFWGNPRGGSPPVPLRLQTPSLNKEGYGSTSRVPSEGSRADWTAPAQ